MSRRASHHNSVTSPTHPKSAEGSLCDLKTRTATARATRPAQSAQRVHFAISKCEPRRDSTHPKRAKGSLCVRKGAPRHSQIDSTHPKRAPMMIPVQGPAKNNKSQDLVSKCLAEVSLCVLKMRTALQRERLDPTKVLRLPRNLQASWKVLRLPRNLHEKL